MDDDQNILYEIYKEKLSLASKSNENSNEKIATESQRLWRLRKFYKRNQLEIAALSDSLAEIERLLCVHHGSCIPLSSYTSRFLYNVYIIAKWRTFGAASYPVLLLESSGITICESIIGINILAIHLATALVHSRF